MFTGIIEEIGIVKHFSDGVLEINASIVIESLMISESISVNGVCLTVTNLNHKSFVVDVVPETLRKSNLSKLTKGSFVNLERSLPLNSRLGGHFVQGHVENIGSIEYMEKDDKAFMVGIKASETIMKYVVEKGFIAIDGISLTVVECKNSYFNVTIVPYTWENTVMKYRNVGDLVNLETDILAKYVEKISLK
ncbi:MAG: riboflavin synthase [Chloroflexi bacterium]|nr:riboflavin synthase [Chloroflexota bacterium]|tara:strand:- start:22742 stop:23317 length:576 start_codon:yes stop_codon:yes gene_type:complete